MEISYDCIVRNEAGEKLTEYVSGELPVVGQVLHIHIWQQRGDFEVLEVATVAQVGGYVVIRVKVKLV